MNARSVTGWFALGFLIAGVIWMRAPAPAAGMAPSPYLFVVAAVLAGAHVVLAVQGV